MKNTKNQGAKALLTGTLLAGSLFTLPFASDASSWKSSSSTADLRAEILGESRIASPEMKCGAHADSTKMKDGKCGEGKCGGKKAKAKDGKCGSEKGKMKDGKCGEGKCGGKKKQK